MKLLDLAVLGMTGGLVYMTWKRHAETKPEPLPAVKKLIKKVSAEARRTSTKPRALARENQSNLLDDSSEGRRIGTTNSDGSTSHHVVGRGVRH